MINKKNVKRVLFAFQLLFTVSLFAFALHQVDFSSAVELFLQNKRKLLFFYPVTLVIGVIGNIFLALRWKVMLRNEYNPPGLIWQLLEINLVANFFNYIIPSTISTDAYRIYILQGRMKHLGKAASTIFFSRFWGLFSIFAIAACSAPFYYENLGWALCLIIETIFLFLLSLFAIALFNGKNRWIERIIYRNKKLYKKSYKTLRYMREIILSPKRVAIVGVYSLLFQLHLAFIYYLAFSIFTDEMPFWGFMAIYPLMTVLLLIPVSIAGIGQREVIFINLYSIIGISETVCLSASLLLFTSTTMFSLFCGLVYIRKRILQSKKNPF